MGEARYAAPVRKLRKGWRALAGQAASAVASAEWQGVRDRVGARWGLLIDVGERRQGGAGAGEIGGERQIRTWARTRPTRTPGSRTTG